MNSSADDVIRSVADAVEQRALARGTHVPALGSVRSMVDSDESEMAVDYLVNTVNSYRLTLGQDEYDRLMWAADKLGSADDVTDIDPQLLVPAADEA
ncbi:hypothetical protein [Streptomyces sp. SID3212]|uniref:hypothetical protein n=1 Tax=Streptomyces sp. SID3212 TaxID=2690259 RepID=UPI0013683BCA|nr:hypothetical protein [Streptomyces sp. SID3212]MYV56227.1 hypothetical protein [Streptomyces sp. SID3212]